MTALVAVPSEFLRVGSQLTEQRTSALVSQVHCAQFDGHHPHAFRAPLGSCLLPGWPPPSTQHVLHGCINSLLAVKF